jgi:signal transduction histidine kinase
MAAAGHDLRQRLHLLLGTIELLTATADQARTRELSQRARLLIFRMAGELEQLAFQAEQQYRCALPASSCFTPATLLGQIRSDWESKAIAKGLRFNVEQVDCQVESDQRLLAVILNNVVGNAVGHTDRGEVNVASSIEGQCLILVVSDTGPGVSEDAILRSFNLSSRSKGSQKGMGLGLAIARKTAELLGHEFELSTALNGGTCVRLRIPLAGG